MEKNYADAYSEVLEVLRYIPREDYKKIPIKTIQLLKTNSNEKNDFIYNSALPFNKQNISKDAKIILAILYRNCWITEEDKKQLEQEEKEHIRAVEEEKRKKYNPDKIFEDKEKLIVQELKENRYPVVQEKWYNKILNKIKQLWLRNHSK